MTESVDLNTLIAALQKLGGGSVTLPIEQPLAFHKLEMLMGDGNYQE
jgi:hypothetical protein